jgi:parallel beta-helix repeat protein
MVAVTVLSVTSTRPEASVDWDVECGAYLTGDETYVLTEDVGPCDGSAPAITVVGPATLKLNGHTVSCELEATEDVDENEIPIIVFVAVEGTLGIKLEGKEARLIGGGKPARDDNGVPANLVTGCDQGVVLNGEGEHRVQGVTVTQSLSGAVVVASDGNKLVGNVVRQVLAWDNSLPIEGNGYLVEGDENELEGNVASDSDDEAGFAIEGNRNVLKGNISKDNVGYGFNVVGNENVFSYNSALKNEQHGFFVDEGSEENVLKHNKSFENGDEPADGIFATGFHIEGDGNELEDNLASRNGLFGIHLTDEASHNKVAHNTVSDSFGFNGLVAGVPVGIGGDLIDDNDDCNDNEWYKNIFGTRSQRCIR